MKEVKLLMILLFALLGKLGNAQQVFPIDFTVLESGCSNQSNELFISEVYDNSSSSGAFFEIYNPSANIVDLSVYSLRRRGDYNSGNWSWNLPLTGNISPGDTYLIKVPNINGIQICSFIQVDLLLADSYGINQNDQIQLLKNGVVLDDVRTPNYTGFTLRRNATAITPRNVYTATDWTIINLPSCTGLGTHSTNFSPPQVTQVRRYLNWGQSVCDVPATVLVSFTSSIGGMNNPFYYNLNDSPTTSTTYAFQINLHDLNAGTHTLKITDRYGCYIKIQFTITGPIQISQIELLNP